MVMNESETNASEMLLQLNSDNSQEQQNNNYKSNQSAKINKNGSSLSSSNQQPRKILEDKSSESCNFNNYMTNQDLSTLMAFLPKINLANLNELLKAHGNPNNDGINPLLLNNATSNLQYATTNSKPPPAEANSASSNLVEDSQHQSYSPNISEMELGKKRKKLSNEERLCRK
jgi:hypothetical protein